MRDATVAATRFRAAALLQAGVRRRVGRIELFSCKFSRFRRQKLLCMQVLTICGLGGAGDSRQKGGKNERKQVATEITFCTWDALPSVMR